MAGTIGATAGNVADHLGVGCFSIVAEMRSCAASPALDTGVFLSPTGPLRGFGWFGLTAQLLLLCSALMCSAMLSLVGVSKTGGKNGPKPKTMPETEWMLIKDRTPKKDSPTTAGKCVSLLSSPAMSSPAVRIET